MNVDRCQKLIGKIISIKPYNDKKENVMKIISINNVSSDGNMAACVQEMMYGYPTNNIYGMLFYKDTIEALISFKIHIKTEIFAGVEYKCIYKIKREKKAPVIRVVIAANLKQINQ